MSETNGTTTKTTPAAATTIVTTPTTPPPTTFTSFKPQLVVEAPKAVDAVAFYKTAFGAEEVSRVMHPKRKAEQELPLVLSADVKIAGNFVFSVSDFADSTPLVKADGATAGIVFTLETEDVSGAITKAIAAGAVAEGEISEVEGAGCVGKLKDPYGYVWVISSPSQAKVSADEPVVDAPTA